MSYQKIIDLAIKFAEKTKTIDESKTQLNKTKPSPKAPSKKDKTKIYNSNDELSVKAERVRAFLNEFKKQMSSLISELGGDYTALKIKKAPIEILQDMAEIRHIILKINKTLSESYALEGSKAFVKIMEHNERHINELNKNIQDFLMSSEITYAPNKRFTQLKIESLQKLLKLIEISRLFLSSNL